MENNLTQIKAPLINSIATKIYLVDTRSRLVYTEGIATRGHVLKRFVPDLINSDLLFHILNLVSLINLSPQKTL